MVTKTNLGMAGFIWLFTIHPRYGHGRKWSRIRDSRIIKGRCLLAHSQGSLSLLPLWHKTTNPEEALSTVGWIFSYQSLRKCPPDLSTGQSDGDSFSIESPSPHVILVSIKLIKINRHITSLDLPVVWISWGFFHKWSYFPDPCVETMLLYLLNLFNKFMKKSVSRQASTIFGVPVWGSWQCVFPYNSTV